MSYVVTLVHFCWQTIHLALTGGKWLTWVVKGATALIALLAASIAIREEVRVAGFSLAAGPEMQRFDLLWSVPAAWSIVIPIVVAWIAIAGGITWARFKRIEIGETVEMDASDRIFQIKIKNLGFTDADVPVCVVAIADEKEIISDNDLAFELSWAGEEVRPKLSKGWPYRVNLCQVFGGPFGIGVWQARLSFTGLNNRNPQRQLAFGLLPERSKLWVAVSIGDYAERRWLSVDVTNSSFNPTGLPSSCKIIFEDPPFIGNARISTRLQNAWRRTVEIWHRR